MLDDEADLPALAAVAAAGKAGGSHFWAQLSHTGRQVSDAINPAPLSPSSVDIDVPRGLGYSFAKPREMTEADIDHAIRQFAFAAQCARRAGFTGVQLHAAHGYLISQFLSPLSNRRTDRWGGPLESRSRFLLAIIDAVRGAVGSDFPIGIKLNSSDFQKGGFTNAECIELVRRLNDSTLDLLELSGGSLEQPKVVGISVKDEGEDRLPESTIKTGSLLRRVRGRRPRRRPHAGHGHWRLQNGEWHGRSPGGGGTRPHRNWPSAHSRSFHSEVADRRRGRKGAHTRSDPRNFPSHAMVQCADRAHGRRFGAGSHFIGTGGGRAIRASGDSLSGATLGKTRVTSGSWLSIKLFVTSAPRLCVIRLVVRSSGLATIWTPTPMTGGSKMLLRNIIDYDNEVQLAH